MRVKSAPRSRPTQEIVAPPIDARDRALLAELALNARLSQVDLAGKVGLSATACARRMAALERAGLIVGYRAVLDLGRLGLSTTVLVRITLESQAEDVLDAFEQAVSSCSSVVRCFLMSGTDDYLLTVLARDISDFEEIHRRQLSRLPGVARIHSSFAIREVINRVVPPAAFGVDAK